MSKPTRCGGARMGVIVATLLVTTIARAELPAETVVRIYPTAVVTSDQVTLKDIATIEGEGAQLAGGWAITAAPGLGQEAVLEQSTVQQALLRRGINPGTWVFRGSAKCRISRPMPVGGLRREVPATMAADTDSVAKPQAADTGSRTGVPKPQAVEPDPDTLEGMIHRHIAERMAGLGGKSSIQMNPALRELLRLSKPTYEFHITDRSDRLVGLVPLEVAIYREGKLEQVQSVLADVSLVKTVVAAAGPINRGQTIRPQDVVLLERTFDRTDKPGLVNLSAAVGQRAIRFINKDEMVTGKDIEPVPLVLRNDVVMVTARRGSVTIKAAAKALTSAGYGEAVVLRNESSKETFTATVTGQKAAE
ncbi:MAG: flagellar basal body P-ring formation protein FlgA [Planctomycetes bacterium]|nr:flagellar basal body P-ring formation protein FlgA [Planctomycetota bacterium]